MLRAKNAAFLQRSKFSKAEFNFQEQVALPCFAFGVKTHIPNGKNVTPGVGPDQIHSEH